MTEAKVIHVHTLSGVAFAFPWEGSLREFVMLCRSQGSVESDTVHIPYSSVAFIGVPASGPSGTVLQLVPKE